MSLGFAPWNSAAHSWEDRCKSREVWRRGWREPLFLKQLLGATNSCQWGNKPCFSIKSAAWWRQYFLPSSKWGYHQINPAGYYPMDPRWERFCQGTALNSVAPRAWRSPAVTQTSPHCPCQHRYRHSHACRGPEDSTPRSLLSVAIKTLPKCYCPGAPTPPSSCCLLSLSFLFSLDFWKEWSLVSFCHLHPLLWVDGNLVRTFTTAQTALWRLQETLTSLQPWTLGSKSLVCLCFFLTSSICCLFPSMSL